MIPTSIMRRRRMPLELEVRRLQEALQARAAGPHSAEVTFDLPTLLAAVWRVCGDRAWTVRELRDQALVDADTARALGQALAVVADQPTPIGSHRVRRIGESRYGVIWMLSPA